MGGESGGKRAKGKRGVFEILRGRKTGTGK